MTITQHFFAEGRYLGSSPREFERVHSELHVPTSYAFFCPVCAEVWGRCPVEHNGKERPYMAWQLCCKKHEPLHLIGIPGSMFVSWDANFCAAFPEEAVKRELSIHLDYAERKGIIV